MTKIILTAWLSISFFAIQAQPASDSLNYPRIGRPCPDFALRNIKYFSKGQATLNDFKGKWLLLSFWNKFCPGCVGAFPKENRWFKKYADKMQFVSIAIQDPEKEIEPMFERYKKRENLSFPVSFDSSLAKRWDIYAGPYFMLIDPAGIVRASAYLPDIVLEQFLEGKSPKVPSYGYYHYDFEKDPRIPLDESKPFLVNNNGGKDDQFSYRSLISELDCTAQRGFVEPTSDDQMKKTGQFSMVGWPLICLYNYAYLGSIWPSSDGYSREPAIEVTNRDSALFNYTSFGNTVCEHGYSYAFTLPVSKFTKEKLMKCMQEDLERYFNFKVSIEQRKFPGPFILVATGKTKAKLKSRGGISSVHQTSELEDYFAKNISLDQFIKDFKIASGYRDLVDSTGITGNIDIDLHCYFGNKSERLAALRANGLDLIPTDVTKKILVIKDGDL